jgi:O-antigen ligase
MRTRAENRPLWLADLHVPAVGRAGIAAPWLLAAVGSVVIAAAASGRMGALVGERQALLLVGGLLGVALLGFFASLGSITLVAWPVLGVVGYDLIRIPRESGSPPILTFDRLWIPGLLAYLAIEHRRVARAPASRLLSLSLLWLVALFGVRAFLADPGITTPMAIWIDAFLLPAILLVAAARYATTPGRMERIAASLMIAGGILGAIGVAERIFGFELATFAGGAVRIDQVPGEAPVSRVSGPFPVPEPYALSLIVCLAATLYWLQTRKGGGYGWGVLFASFELGGLAFSLFRAAWIAGLIVVIASFGIRPRRFARALAVAGFVGAIAVAATTQLEQNKTFAQRAHDTDNIYGRLATYKQGIEMFKSAPVFGVGVDRYVVVARSRDPVKVKNVEAIDFPHSSYIWILVEQGLVGFLPLLLLSLAVWRVLRALRRVAFAKEDGVLIGALAGAAMGVLIMSLTLTMLPYGPSNGLFAVLLGAASGRLDALTRGT